MSPTLRSGFLATLGLLASASLAPAQTPPSQPPAAASNGSSAQPMAEPQVGDHWTYELRDDITGELKSTLTQTVTDISPAEISIRTAALGKPGFGFQTFDHSWNLLNGGIWRYAPNDGMGIRAPLEVGKNWSFSSADSNTTAGVSVNRSGNSKVTAKESITTRAGTFETFKIETTIQTQNANDPTKKFQAEQQTWYAPTLDHWVKRVFTTRWEGRVRERSTTELVEYGRRQ